MSPSACRRGGRMRYRGWSCVSESATRPHAPSPVHRPRRDLLGPASGAPLLALALLDVLVLTRTLGALFHATGWHLSLLVVGWILSLQRSRCGAVQHLSPRHEAAAVTGAVPGALGAIPAHDATQVRASGRDRV